MIVALKWILLKCLLNETIIFWQRIKIEGNWKYINRKAIPAFSIHLSAAYDERLFSFQPDDHVFFDEPSIRLPWKEKHLINHKTFCRLLIPLADTSYNDVSKVSKTMTAGVAQQHMRRRDAQHFNKTSHNIRRTRRSHSSNHISTYFIQFERHLCCISFCSRLKKKFSFVSTNNHNLTLKINYAMKNLIVEDGRHNFTQMFLFSSSVLFFLLLATCVRLLSLSPNAFIKSKRSEQKRIRKRKKKLENSEIICYTLRCSQFWQRCRLRI